MRRLDRQQARKRAAAILAKGKVAYTTHASERLVERNMDMNDVRNVLRAGQILQEPELEHGTWRYRVETERMAVVIAFRGSDELVVVTAMRLS